MCLSAQLQPSTPAYDLQRLPTLRACTQDTSFPAYDRVKAEHVVPGMKAVLAEANAAIDKLEANVVPTWEGLVEPLERITDKHERTWSIVSHLKVRSDPIPSCTRIASRLIAGSTLQNLHCRGLIGSTDVRDH